MELAHALERAIPLARLAGDLLRRDWHRPEGPRGHVDKAEADTEAEELIRAGLRAEFPRWHYLGEELGRSTGVAGAPIWLVDPNDGTRDYLVGRRGSAVSIGLIVEQRPVLGVIFAFAYPDDEGDLFSWAEGCGPLRRNGVPVDAHLPDALGPLDVVLVSSGGDRHPEANLRCASPGRYRSVPSIAHRLALVAAGEAAAATSIFAPGAWDYAAGHALLRGSGGTLVNEDGREVAYAEDGTSQTKRAFGGSRALAVELARRPWERADSQRSADPVPARLSRGEGCADAARLSRAQGCFFGLIAGGNLGAWRAGTMPSSDSPPDAGLPLQDGGAMQLLAGQPTAASEAALDLARSLVAAPETVNEWGGGYEEALLRSSVVGVFAHSAGPDAVARLAGQGAALAHDDSLSTAASACQAVGVAHAITHGDPDGAYAAARDWARQASIDTAVRHAIESAERAPSPGRAHDEPILTALQNAFFELKHAADIEAGVWATLQRGGATDANAAVAGALLGAVHGRRAIPPQWRSAIMSCRAHPLRTPHPRPMRFWPVDLSELAECLLIAGEFTRRPK